MVINFHINAAMAGAVMRGSSSNTEIRLLTEVPSLEKQGDGQTEQQFHADRDGGVAQRNADGVPELGIEYQVGVVAKSDEALEAGQIQPESLGQ